MEAFNGRRKKKLINQFMKGALRIDCSSNDTYGINKRASVIKHSGCYCFNKLNPIVGIHLSLEKINRFVGTDINTITQKKGRKVKHLSRTYYIRQVYKDFKIDISKNRNFTFDDLLEIYEHNERNTI